MIKTKTELNRFLRVEEEIYKGDMNTFMWQFLTHFPIVFHETPELYKYIRTLRKTEYYFNTNNTIFAVYYKTRLRYLQYKHGLSIPINVFDIGLKIMHLAQTRVASQCKIGKNFTIYPFCSIGTGNGKHPVLGNNITVFSGARIIGGIKLADGILVGANAVVTKSFEISNAILAGVPAKIIN